MNYFVKEEATLLDVLTLLYPDSSNKTRRHMLKSKRVRVDDTVEVKANTLLREGQNVSVGKNNRKLFSGFDLIYRDKDLIVIDKATGLLSVPLDNDDKEENALDILRTHFRTNDIFAVHRIDRGTSGILIFAKGKRCNRQLAKMFRQHDFQREYIAIVEGKIKENSGTWSSRLAENENFTVYSTNKPDEGRLSITHFTVLKRSPKFSYLRLHLETGRKHQIRVHAKDAGCPIVGDRRYGSKACDPISRMCLHASSLIFIHPHTGKEMHFTAPPPKGFGRLGFPA